MKLAVPVRPPSLDEIVADPEVPLSKSPEFVISQYNTVPLSTSVVAILNVADDPSSIEVGPETENVGSSEVSLIVILALSARRFVLPESE